MPHTPNRMTLFFRSTPPRTLALGAGLLFSLALAAPGAAQRTESVARAVAYYETYEAADSLYDAGHYAEAADALEALTSEYPDDPSVWFSLARARDRLGERRDAIGAYRVAFDLGYQYGAWIPYRIAQLYGLSGAVDSAFVWLGHAMDARWDDRPGIARDEAFATLRGDPRFRRVVGGLPHDLSRDEGWRFDIHYLVEEARRMHVGPGDPAFSAEFDSAAAVLKAAVPDLSNDEIVVGLQRLMTLLGDGHTGIYGPGDESALEFDHLALPVLFYAFDDGLYIVDAVGDARRWIGHRVTAFGPRPTAAVLRELPSYVHHDNAMTPLWLGVRFTLRRLPVLAEMGATDDLRSVPLVLEDRSSTRRRVVLKGGEFDFRRKLRPPQDQNSAPRWLRHVDRNYWLDSIPEAGALYWQFNQVRNVDGGPSIAEFADTLRASLETTGVRTLVVDVRHNNGGNNGLLDPLLRTLVWWEQDEPGRRIFVITGRNTFSAAQNFINRVERWTDAVFVGEPSSSRPNFAGEETSLVLPYSGVRGSISNRYWQDSAPDDVRPWIAPQVPVTLSSDDYFAGLDPALEAILAIVSDGRGTLPRPPDNH